MTGTRRLEGRRVLVPRGGDWGRRVAALLAAEGADAVVVPLIAFAPPDDVAALDAAVGRLRAGAYDWLAVTSRTTVTALAERIPAVLGAGAGLADLLAGTPVAAVGPGTARVLQEHGVDADLLPSGERSGAGLVEELVARGRRPGGGGGRRVLVPHSDLAEPTVVDGLRSAGWVVDEVVAYRTVPGPPPGDDVVAAWRSGAIGAVLLSSASTARNLVDLLGAPPPSVVVCCIGSRTAAAARTLGLRVDVRPANASGEELVEALAAHAARGRPDDPGPASPAPATSARAPAPSGPPPRPTVSPDHRSSL
jgi:uroporphyrinogen-III synthase